MNAIVHDENSVTYRFTRGACYGFIEDSFGLGNIDISKQFSSRFFRSLSIVPAKENAEHSEFGVGCA